MDRFSSSSACQGCSIGCSHQFVCRCLRVTETAVVEAIEALGLQSVKEVRQHTGAGDGCTCCHAKIRNLIEKHAGRVAMPMAAAV